MSDTEEIVARPLRLAMFSPLPPAASGIADYTADLLPNLPGDWSVDVYVDEGGLVDDGVERGEAGEVDNGAAKIRRYGDLVDRCACDLQVLPHGEWAGRHGASPYDATIYQVGNNVLHAYALPYVLEHPGLLVLHDGVLHPARAQHAIERGAMDEYRATAERCRPDLGRALGHLVAAGLSSPGLYFGFPLCEDLVRASRLTGVHGELLAGWLRALVPDAEVTPLVHWREVPEADPERVAAWRKRLEADVLIGCFGFVGAARRLDRVIEALGDLPDLDFKLVVAGWVDPSLRLPQRVAARRLEDRVVLLGRVERADFAALMRGVDLAVNLRWPPARASSGVLHQLLQVGVPAVITDLVHWRDVPEPAVARVPPGPDAAERAVLREALERWITDAAERTRASEAARTWAAAHIGPERMAGSYVRAIEGVLA